MTPPGLVFAAQQMSCRQGRAWRTKGFTPRKGHPWTSLLPAAFPWLGHASGAGMAIPGVRWEEERAGKGESSGMELRM